MKNPDDLVTLREASSRSGKAVETLRGWIYTDKTLPTYREPGHGDRVMVSAKKVEQLAAHYEKREGGHRRCGRKTTVGLPLDVAALLKRASASIATRLGLPSITLVDTVRILAEHELDRHPPQGGATP